MTRNHLRVLVSILLFILAVPIGLWFLLHDSPYPFSKLKYLWGFWLSWVLSTLISFLVMTLGEYATRLLDKNFPWHINWTKRLIIQLGVGVALPLAVAVAWNAGVFTGRKAVMNLESYFGSEFWLTLALLLVFNALCCTVLLVWRHLTGLIARAEETAEQARDLKRQAEERLAMKVEAARDRSVRKKAADSAIDTKHLLQHAAYIESCGHACQVFRFDGTQELVVKRMDAFYRRAGPSGSGYVPQLAGKRRLPAGICGRRGRAAGVEGWWWRL